MHRRSGVLRSLAASVAFLVCCVAGSAHAQRRSEGPPPPPWKTDTTNAIIDLDSLSRTGRRDGIPSLDHPTFVSQAEAAEWLGDKEPVVALAVGNDVRAYPVQILMHHDVVNDIVNGQPVAITFCILCGSALAYDRRFDGQILEFGYAGMLFNSNLVMYDRQTETWWGQIVGQGLVGRYAGQKLHHLSAPLMSFREFRQQAPPDAKVLSRDTGFDRPYGRGRMKGYDKEPNPIARIFRKAVDVRLHAKERVIVFEHGEEIVAIPFSALRERRVISTRVGQQDVVAFWGSGTTSIYADSVASGEDIGAAIGYEPVVQGRHLTFMAIGDGTFEDRETKSRWTLSGRAVSGPLQGATMTAVDLGTHFWFAWAAYRPQTKVITR